jgi:hypothetical protein
MNPRSTLETLALRLPPDVDLRQSLKSILPVSLKKAEDACTIGVGHTQPRSIIIVSNPLTDWEKTHDSSCN